MTYVPNYEKVYGNKYEETKDLDITGVAKILKTELKAKWPGIKWSVTTKRYSGGQSLNVKIRELPPEFQLHNPEWLRKAKETGRLPQGVGGHYSEEAEALLEEVKRMVEAYNYNGSDTMSDYFNVRFYKNVSFSYDMEKARKESETKELTKELSVEELVHIREELVYYKSLLVATRNHMASIEAEIAKLYLWRTMSYDVGRFSNGQEVEFTANLRGTTLNGVKSEVTNPRFLKKD